MVEPHRGWDPTQLGQSRPRGPQIYVGSAAETITFRKRQPPDVSEQGQPLQDSRTSEHFEPNGPGASSADAMTSPLFGLADEIQGAAGPVPPDAPAAILPKSERCKQA